MIIISEGRLVAIDSVANLTNRLRGAEAVAIEVETAGGRPVPDEVQVRLEQVPGVSRVVAKEPRDGSLCLKWRACRAATSAPTWRAAWCRPAGTLANFARWA